MAVTELDAEGKRQEPDRHRAMDEGEPGIAASDPPGGERVESREADRERGERVLLRDIERESHREEEVNLPSP